VAHSPSIVWFHNDLRLADNPALEAARNRGGSIIPVFIWAPDEEAEWKPGAASRWWLHQSLTRLAEKLQHLGSRLVIWRGPSSKTLKALIKESHAGAVFWNRRYEPALIKRDRQVEEQLREHGCFVETFDSALLCDPWKLLNKSNKPFQVFTAFWKNCLLLGDPAEPSAAPRKLNSVPQLPGSLDVSSLELEPRINWASGLAAVWEPGENGAAKLLRRLLSTKLENYRIDRNRPDLEGTSRLSPHLHFGEISPRQIWHALRLRAEKAGQGENAWKSGQFLTEIGWREFAYYLLCHYPHIPSQPLRKEFEHFPWCEDASRLKAWERGQTGYPLVDAGMRELWSSGWMHNRVRMVVASFLIKDLLIPWQAGARWFWDTLVDADLANNTLGWQWTAGCGADSAPFFRVFNPVTQGEKFDPKGEYVRRWVPEIARLPNQWIHKPWAAPASILTQAGVRLGITYPHPIVDHAVARRRALAAFAKIKSRAVSILAE
jgi:deoxyribodipyrimidine photo-lyase